MEHTAIRKTTQGREETNNCRVLIIFFASELVNKVTERFGNIVQVSADLTAKLQLIKESTAEFLKLCIPLGGLIYASMNIIHKVCYL